MTIQYHGYTSTKGNADLDALVSNNASAIAFAISNTSWITHAALNVKSAPFNATGLNVADDSAAFLAAIAFAASGVSTSRAIYVPNGTYKISQKLSLPSNIWLYGEGAQSIINAQCADMLFDANGKSNVRITDLATTGICSAAIHIVGGSGHRILRNAISGATIKGTLGSAAGIWIENIANTVVELNYCSGNGDGVLDSTFDILSAGGQNGENQNITISKNRCASTTCWINIGLVEMTGGFVTHNECSGALTIAPGNVRGGYGIMLYNGTLVAPFNVANNCVVSNNYVHDVQGIGIYIQRFNNTLVTDNIIGNTGSVQLDVSLGVGGIVIDGGTGCTASGNRIIDSHSHAITIVGGGGPNSINTSCTVNNNIIDNVINGAFQAISVRGTPSDLAITNNVITRAAGMAIAGWSDDLSLRVTVTGNTIRTVGAYGVWVRPSAINWTVKNNIISGLADPTLGVVDQAANTSKGANTIEGSVVFDVDQMPSRFRLFGDATNATPQIQLGTLNGFGAIGAKWSGGDAFMATNATHDVGADGWHQSNPALASRLWLLNVAGDFAMHVAAIGTPPGNFASFWGTPIVAFNSTGMKVAGIKVIGVQQAAIADIATADATDLASAIALVNVCKAKINANLSMERAHGLLAP